MDIGVVFLIFNFGLSLGLLIGSMSTARSVEAARRLLQSAAPPKKTKSIGSGKRKKT